MNIGLIAIGAGIAIFTGFASSIGESLICCHAIDGMARNPENASKLNGTMILAVALDETCAIYALIIAILIIFILPGYALQSDQIAASAAGAMRLLGHF